MVPTFDENGWVEQAAGGDRAAYGRLVDCYWVSMRRWLRGLTGNEHFAEDIAQEAFLKAWIALPGFRRHCRFRAWLFQIARRCWLDARRRPDARPLVGIAEDASVDSAGPLAELELSETRERIATALAELPDDYRAAYLLFTQEELPYGEIGEILDISEENARWRVYRARRSLQHQLNSYLST
jgi:RNA polymerase sigma-70 factor, ECF subfamily